MGLTCTSLPDSIFWVFFISSILLLDKNYTLRYITLPLPQISGSPSHSRRRTNSGGSGKIKGRDKRSEHLLEKQQQIDSSDSPSFLSFGKSKEEVGESSEAGNMIRPSEHQEGPSPKKRVAPTTATIASLTSPDFRPPSVLSKMSQGDLKCAPNQWGSEMQRQIRI